MERLTKRVDGIAVLESWAVDKDPVSVVQRLCSALAAYEDTGMEPEEIKKHEAAYNECLTRTYGPFKQKISKWLQAEQDGRLVVLPCKVGDSIYIPDLEKKIPVKVRVQGISISVSGRTILHFGGYPVECAWGDGCGKDWFLTREAADVALSQKSTIPCKYGVSRHRNEIGEDEVYCELNARWMNVTLGDCLGNCESAVILEGENNELYDHQRN